MNYKVINDSVWMCRLIDAQQKKNCVVAKFGRYDTGEFLFSLVRDSYILPICKEELQKRKSHYIHQIEYESSVGFYHIYTWDDVDNGLCTANHVGEVQRDKNNNPMVWTRVIVFGNMDNAGIPDADKTLHKEYVEINTPEAKKALEYRKKPFNQGKTYVKRRYDNEDNYISDEAYVANEQRKWDRMDMNEEDRIMDALENGMGELYGF